MENRQRQAKARIQQELQESMSTAKSVVFVDFRGVTVENDTKLRRSFREGDVTYKVVKNTLTQRAAESLGLSGMDEIFEGPTAMAFSQSDPVAPAKILAGYRREIPTLSIKGGILEGAFIDAAMVTYLGTLPPKEELLAKVAGSFQAPMVGLASVLNATLSGFARAVDALRLKKEQSA